MIDKLLQFVNGELSGPEGLELFAELVNTGYAWQLEGHMGREAARLIESGMLIVTEIGPPVQVKVNEDYMEEE